LKKSILYTIFQSAAKMKDAVKSVNCLCIWHSRCHLFMFSA